MYKGISKCDEAAKNIKENLTHYLNFSNFTVPSNNGTV